MIKKMIATFVISILFFIMINVNTNAYTIQEAKDNIDKIQLKTISKFSDVTKDAWFLRNVSILAEMGIINGYQDKTFKPNETLTKAQFVKMVVKSLGYVDIAMSSDYWAKAYINKAQDLGILDRSAPVTSENYDVPIARGDMTIIIVRAIREEDEKNAEECIKLIKDYSAMNELIKKYVLKTYSKGIINGYQDGEFKSDNYLTRAEAATVMIRMFDKSERVKIELPSK